MILELSNFRKTREERGSKNLMLGPPVFYPQQQNIKPDTEAHPYSFFEEQYAEQGLVFTHFEGLCGDCDLKENCIWRTQETIIFSCEHYS